MVTRITTWSPDTCNCVLEYSWDDSIPLDNQTFPVANIIKKCDQHTALSTKESIYSAVKEENTRKNITYQGILDNGPTSLYDLQADGSRTLKNGITFSWTWSGTAPNRVLTITYTGITLTTNQRNTAQNWLNNHFGTGVVVLG